STAAARAQPLTAAGTAGREKTSDSLLTLVSRAAQTDDPVLISGGTSAARQSIARAIHHRSQRSSQRFVPMANWAEVSPYLVPGILFGFEKMRGFSTGAVSWRPGRLEIAHLGTLFVDDISELAQTTTMRCYGHPDFPFDSQLMLLRALQERRFTRL